jgi:hypothetical protein
MARTDPGSHPKSSERTSFRAASSIALVRRDFFSFPARAALFPRIFGVRWAFTRGLASDLLLARPLDFFECVAARFDPLVAGGTPAQICPSTFLLDV